MRIELDTDHRIRTYDRTRARQQITLTIVIAIRHHRAVKPEHHHVDRRGCAELIENLVPQALIGGASRPIRLARPRSPYLR